MKFKKEDLQDLIGGCSVESLTLIEDQITSNSRWSIHHDIVFQDNNTNKFYITYYSIGATEYQDESPFEYEPDEIECGEVFPHQVMTIVYKKDPQLNDKIHIPEWMFD